MLNARKNIAHSDLLILLKKIGAVKSKEEHMKMGPVNGPIYHKKKQRLQPSHYKHYLPHYLFIPMEGEQ